MYNDSKWCNANKGETRNQHRKENLGHELVPPDKPMSMGAVGTHESDAEEPEAKDKGDNKDSPHVNLPPPGYRAVPGKDNFAPTLIKVSVEPCEVGHEGVGLRK